MIEDISEVLGIANQHAESAKLAASRCEDFAHYAERSQRVAEEQAQTAGQFSE